ITFCAERGWAAAVDIVGIGSWVSFLERTSPWRRPLREAEYGTLAGDREFLEAISPITHVDRIRAPLMVIHGANDPRVPVYEAEPTGIVVIAHPLPTHGGTMRNPLVAALARASAERGWYALRFNFRGVGSSAGEWAGGRSEPDDVAAAVDYARGLTHGVRLGLAGYSFGALMVLEYVARGGRADAVALVGVGLRDQNGAPRRPPDVPRGTFIVAAENDQFGTAEE